MNNEVELERIETFLRFEITMEPVPQSFDGMRWRSYVKKICVTEIRAGLEAAKPGVDFSSYGETIMVKVED